MCRGSDAGPRAISTDEDRAGTRTVVTDADGRNVEGGESRSLFRARRRCRIARRRPELRDPFVDAQLGDAETREELSRAAREPANAAPPERERLAFYALRTLAAVQTFVEGVRRLPELRSAGVSR
jgi:hypothetical protein